MQNSKCSMRIRFWVKHSKCFCIRFRVLQCFSLKCRPQHGGWRWQPLIAQVPTGKLKAIPPLHGSLQLSKITKKNNHLSYNVRYWKCCPLLPTHFWNLFRNVHLHGFINFRNTVNFTYYCVGVCDFYLWWH